MKKFIGWMIGIMCAIDLTAGLAMLVPYKTFTTVAAIIILCLSICSGILAPNPISLYGLVIGVCMLVFPPQIVGIILLAAGLIGAGTNWFCWKKGIYGINASYR